jgi:hypothetical protein
MPRLSHPPRLKYSNITWRRVQINSILLHSFILLHVGELICTLRQVLLEYLRRGG